MKHLASNFSEDSEVYSNPNIDFKAELQFLNDRILKCENNLKE